MDKKVLLIKYEEENILKSISGFQITHGYFDKNPSFRISIITFTSSFDPSKGRGYYLDIHFRTLVRKFKEKSRLKVKKETIKKSLILLQLKRINIDILKYISLFF